MKLQDKQFSLVFFLTLAIILFWPFFLRAQGEINLNPPSPGCIGSEAFVNLTWTSTIGGTPTYSVLRKVQGEATFTEINSTQNLFYPDQPVDSDKSSVYKIRADDVESNTETASAAYCPPVLSPATTSCAANGPYITLNWSSISGALSIYEVYRDGVKIGQTSATTFTDGPNIEGTKTYNYFIKAIWQDGTARNSDTISVTATACPPTLTVSADCLGVAPGGPKVNLSWNILLGVQKYEIYRKAQGETDFSLLKGELTETSYADNLVSSLPTYWQGGQISYKVKAVWLTTERDSSPQQISIPRCPPFLKVESNCDDEFSFRLSWTATRNATHYNIYRDGSFLYQNIGTTTTTFTDYLNLTTCPDQICDFTYHVEALVTGLPNLPSNSISQSIDCATIVPPSPPPLLNLPETFCVTGDSRVKLSWTPSNNVVYYGVYRNGTELTKLYQTSFTDPGVQSGIEYIYWIVAYGKGGTSTISDNTQAITAVDCTPPSTPTLTLSIGCTNGQPWVNLSWTETTNTLAYEIHRGTSSTDISLLITFEKNSPEFISRTWRDTGVSASATYYYKIVAKGPKGIPSSSSDIKAITTLSCLPTTPILNLTTTCEVNNPVVNLSWTTDGGNTTRYEIFRQDWSPTIPIQIINDITVKNWKDTSVSPETTYNYKVEAVGPSGRSTQGYKSIATYYCLPPGPFTLNEPNIFCQGSYPRAETSWTSSSNSWYYRLYRYGANTDNISGIYATSFSDWGFGNALIFNSATPHDDYVDFGNPAIPLTGNLTIEFWARPRDIGHDRQNIICKAFGAEFCLAMETNGSLSYYHGSAGDNASPYMGFTTSNIFTNNTWVHVVITRNMSTRTVRVYKNGVFVNSTTWSSTYDPSSSTITLKVGRGYVHDFIGTIDEVRLYSRVLTDTEIPEYFRGIYTNEPGIDSLIGLWHFDEGSGQFASDSSNYGNNGILGSTSGTDTNDPSWNTITNNPWNSLGLQWGSQYYWRARAYGLGGDTWSNTTDSYLMPQCPPTQPGLVLTSFCETGTNLPAVTLRWSYSILTSTYEIYRQNKGLIGTIGQTVDSSLRTFTDNNEGAGFSENTTYTYYVKAIGPTGLTNQSDSLSILTPSCLAPTKPENLQATFSCGGATNSNPQVNLSWDPSQNASYYTIYRDGGFLATTTATSYTDTAVNTNSDYSYYVIAYGPGGSSPPSDLVTITTGYCTPSTPSITFLTTDCENQSPVNTILWSDPDGEARQIFNDGFETGDFSKWSGIFQDDGITSVTNVDPYQGTYHSQFKLNPVNNWDGYGGSYYNIPTTQTYLYLRAYYKFDSLPSEGYSYSFNMFLPQYWGNRSAVSLVRQDGQYFWQLFFAGRTTNSVSFFPQTNTWYSVELYAKVGTVAGEAKVWINGDLKAFLPETGGTSIDVSGDSQINQVRAWLYTSGPPGTERTFRMDSVIVSDRYIGPGVPVYNADRYEIYRNTVNNSSTATLIKTVTTSDPEFLERVWKDTSGLNNKQQYYYWVKSVGPAGTSSFSNSKNITTYFCGIPSTPSLYRDNLFCKDNLPYATLSWTTDPNAYSYNLYRTNPDNSSSTYSTRISPLTDKGSYALKFDGVNDYVVIGKNDDKLNKFDAGLTVEVWGKQTSYTGGNDSWLLDKDYTGYRIWGYDRLRFCVRTPTQWWNCAGDTTPTLNQWYHLVGVVDNINQKIYIYINGQLNATVDLATKYNFDFSSTLLTFGKHSDDNRFWPGVIDEVRIYGRALSATEINEHYQGIYKNGAELRGAWHFEEGEGTTISDSSGQGNNGKIAGPAWVEGKTDLGKALEFGGLNGYVNVPDSAVLDISQELTVEAWFKTNIIPPSGYKTIASKDENSEIHINSAGKIYWGWQNSAGTGRSRTGNTIITPGNWYHVAIVYSKSQAFQRIYLDGNPDSPIGTYEEDLRLNDDPFQIASDQGSSGRFFDGTIDEVRIYNRALSATEITEHKNGIFNNETGLVGLWHFDEGSGNIAYDDSLFGNNGTLIKGAEWDRPSTATYYVSPLEGGKFYKYNVKAVGVKVESPASNEISFTTLFCLPTKPDLVVESQCDYTTDPPNPQLKLSWQSDPNTQYWSIYKSREGGPFKFITNTTLTSYIDGDVESGVNYEYYLVAVGKGVNSTSDAVTETVPFCYPSPYDGNPFSITAAPGCYGYSSRIKIEWPIDQTGNTIYYNIWRKNTATGEEIKTKEGLAATVTSYLDIVDEEQNYIYKVEAVGSGEGNYLFSNESSEVTSLPCSEMPPNSPNLTSCGITSIAEVLIAVCVEWRDVGNAEYYKLFRQGSPEWTEIVQKDGYFDGSTMISHVDDTVSEDKSYNYVVVGYNANAPYNPNLLPPAYGGTVSNTITAYVPIARPGNFTLSGSRVGNKISLTWTEAATTPTGGTVYYKVLRDSSSAFDSPTVICGNITAPPFECYDNNPTALEIFYKAVATNLGGETFSNIIKISFPLPIWREIPPW